MEGIGAEVSQKIRSAIKAKLMEIGVYVDEELPDYVMVMVANKRSKEQMDDDLQLFLGKHTSLFTTWLHQVLQKLQEVTVANLGGVKRKLSEDSKKKKKSKQNVEKKELKKKIKDEPEDEPKAEVDIREKRESVVEEDHDSVSSNQRNEPVELAKNKKQKTDMDPEAHGKETKTIPKDNVVPHEQNNYDQQKAGEDTIGARSKSRSISSQAEDLDDEDCINIRTDGELLDTTEDLNTEELTKKTREKEDLTSSKESVKHAEKKRTTLSHSQTRPKVKTKSVDRGDSADRFSHKVQEKKQSSPHENSPKVDDKVVDARELLNRKKAAKQSENTARTKSRDRSTSPSRKRRDDGRKIYRDDNRKTVREDERESSTRRLARDDERDRRNPRDRDSHLSKRRGDDRQSRRNDSDRQDSREKRRESSHEPPPKRVMLEKPFRNKTDDWDSDRPFKTSSSDGRKMDESSAKRRAPEVGRKRSQIVSRVVARPQEPEEEVEAPVPSVVKVTPRPRRPPSQQASSTLIMKAISEANKSLANVPQRPDSTQRARKEPVFTRKRRLLERIPPEKIAVSITNPLALQKVDKIEVKDDNVGSPPAMLDEETNNQSPNNIIEEVTSSEPDTPVQRKQKTIEVQRKGKEEEDKVEEESHQEEPHQEEPKEDEQEVEPTTELEDYDEPMEEMSDPQFVVTLNGYDPDGLYSQSELDLNEEGDNDDWLKENIEEDPLLTSTPDEMESPRPKRDKHSSPIVIMNTPVNHSNLIEVEIMKGKSTERCKYWPACRLADKCTFYHPSKPCKVFPACKFGDACLYIHPQCKFNALCTRKDCVFAHTPAHTPLQPAAVPKAKALYAANAPQPCKFYPNCTNINCQFAHPPRACRFGLYCTKKDCSFDHGQVAPVDKLKWTRVSTT